jgi:hypothetical protein
VVGLANTCRMLGDGQFAIISSSQIILRLSPEVEAWIVPKAAAEGLSAEVPGRVGHARRAAFAPRPPTAVPRVLRHREGLWAAKDNQVRNGSAPDR